MRVFLALLALGALLQQPPGYSPIQDGEAHGDPPYLLEEGWEPLLNGTDLTGWKSCESAAKNEWYTTRSVRYGATTSRNCRPTGRIEFWRPKLSTPGSSLGAAAN